MPLRLEVSPGDAAAAQLILVRHDTWEKRPVPIDALAPVIQEWLGDVQAELLNAARRMLAELTVDVDTFDELTRRVAVNAGWSLAHWCGNAACEAQIKAETKATIR